MATKQNLNVKPEEGEVIVKLVKPEVAGLQEFSCYKNDKGETVFYKDGNGKNSKVTFTGPITKLKRSNPVENRVIDFMLGYMKSASWQKRSPALTIIDRIDDAKSKNSARQLKLDASTAVNQYISEDKIFDLCYLLGVFVKIGQKDPSKLDTDGGKEILKNEIFTILDLNPQEVIDAVNSPEKDFVITFHKGVAKGIFKLENNSMYKYNNSPMGTTVDECVVWLRTNADVYASLKGQIDK